MQYRTLEAKAVKTIKDAFAKVRAMSPAKQAEAGYSVSPKGGRTIQQMLSPKHALEGKTGKGVPEGTVCNFWQSGTDDNDVRIYVVAPKKPAKPKKVAESRMDALEAKVDAGKAETDAKLDAILAKLTK